MNVPPWGWKAARWPAATASVSEVVDHLEERVPAGVGQHRGAWLARPAGAFLATGRQFEGDDQDLAAAVVEQAEPLAGDGASRRQSVRRPSPGSTGRPRPAAGRARRAPRAAPRPPGSRCRAGCPRTRSGRSRRGSSARRCRAAGRRGRRCSTGSARSRSTRAGQGVARSSQGGAEVGPRTHVSGEGGHRCCSSATPAAHRARCSGWCSGLGASHQPVLSGPAVARSRSTMTWTNDGPPDASARRTAGATSAGSFDALGMEPEGTPDVVEGRGVERAVRRAEIGPRRAAEERLLAALDADPARVVEDDGAHRGAGQDRGLELLHRLEEAAVARDRDDLAVGLARVGRRSRPAARSPSSRTHRT